MYLASKLDLSRSQVQKMIKDELILINGDLKTSHYKTQEGDEIKVIKTKKPAQANSKAGKLPKFKTVTETDDYLIINKPAGVIVHGGEGITELTLVDALEKKYPAIKKVGEDPMRPGIVHRLDKEASGLMVVAKNNPTFNHIKEQFKDRETLKKYYALVYGQTEKEYDEIDFLIARSTKGYKMAALPVKQEGLPRHSETKAGKRAITEFDVEQKFINYTLLNIKIKTGRTHQIRVHMSAYDHPIVGDNLYGTKKTRDKNVKLNLGRIFLHAYTLGFKDLNDEWQEFKIELPSELKKFLKTIK